jgi:hypothetical protein
MSNPDRSSGGRFVLYVAHQFWEMAWTLERWPDQPPV